MRAAANAVDAFGKQAPIGVLDRKFAFSEPSRRCS
jgi:hypothetical protein